mmetsp:Transcript_24882/g.30583  ORF Transcript_24882/g.30583 Transcript_24882/m.30583 type:complete len:321 (+) Transcript_24882:255-1217(+)
MKPKIEKSSSQEKTGIRSFPIPLEDTSCSEGAHLTTPEETQNPITGEAVTLSTEKANSVITEEESYVKVEIKDVADNSTILKVETENTAKIQASSSAEETIGSTFSSEENQFLISPCKTDSELLRGASESEDDNTLQTAKSEDVLLRGWNHNATEMDAVVIHEKENEDVDERTILKMVRKASVAVTGTALVAVGIPMIPMPTPGGVLVTGSGMALLATEFPAAQRILDRSRDGLENLVGNEEDDDEQEEINSNKTEQKSRVNKKPDGLRLVKMDEVDEIINAADKAGKRTKRSLKRFVRRTILPIMSKVTTDKEATMITL